MAYHALKNRADAEDVMQTTLLRLLEHRQPFESEEHMKHWLLRVAVNESRKLLRSGAGTPSPWMSGGMPPCSRTRPSPSCFRP